MLNKTCGIALLTAATLSMFPVDALAEVNNSSANAVGQQGRQGTNVTGNSNNVNQYIKIVNRRGRGNGRQRERLRNREFQNPNGGFDVGGSRNPIRHNNRPVNTDTKAPEDLSI